MRVHAMGCSALLLVAAANVGAGADRKAPPRSLYVPVEFSLCEHLTKALLLENMQPVGTLPARRTFQFTYYPDLQRIAPEVIQLRIEGVYAEGGDPFVARLAVTPTGLHTARDHVLLAMKEETIKSRPRLDLHHETIDFFIRCDRFCSRKKAESP